jgi:hypothetical protein
MCAVVTIKIYFSDTKVTVPYGAPSYTYYLVSYQEVHSFTSFFNRFAIVGIVPVSDHTISVFGIKDWAGKEVVPRQGGVILVSIMSVFKDFGSGKGVWFGRN